MTTLTMERMTYLREYLREKLDEISDFDLFLDEGDDQIIWLSHGDETEVVIITLQPGKIEVAK